MKLEPQRFPQSFTRTSRAGESWYQFVLKEYDLHASQKFEAPLTGRHSEKYLVISELAGMVHTIHDIQTSMQNMERNVELMKGDIRNIMKKLDDVTNEDGELRETEKMPVGDIKNLILTEMEVDKPFYPSDVALDHNLDYDDVLEAVELLRREGHIKD